MTSENIIPINMDSILSKYNCEIRNGKRRIMSSCIIRKREGLLHVCFSSQGCKYRKQGSCTMCDYGEGNTLSLKDIKDILPEIAEAARGMDSILIGALGSIFDPLEISKECLELICKKLVQIPIATVIFETHYTMITEELCKWLIFQLPKKDVVVELGLESVDSLVQKKCLNKLIDIKIFKEKIKLLHNYGISVTANVFLGAPFLLAQQQIEDSERTILWAIENGVDSVVLFPANIRKNTLLEYLYNKNKYNIISQWHVLEVLDRIPMQYLERIYLAWYGDWIDRGENGAVENLPPYACKICNSQWQMFYKCFANMLESKERKNLIQNFKNKVQICECREKFRALINESDEEEREERIYRMHMWLNENFIASDDKRMEIRYGEKDNKNF